MEKPVRGGHTLPKAERGQKVSNGGEAGRGGQRRAEWGHRQGIDRKNLVGRRKALPSC